MSRAARELFRFPRWALSPEGPDQPGHLWPRWIFLRALGFIFASAFYSLLFQINGLIGPQGILPAGQYLEAVSRHLGLLRYWYAPTLLWLGSGPAALHILCWAGLAASILLFLNLWPRASIAVCLVSYLSFVSAAQDFASYQSDGMLLATGFLALFFAAPGVVPGLGERHPPSRASLFLLQWLWFRIYFESGVAKIAGGDPEWRHLTALYEYYSNGPLPNWVGWYAQHLPHGFNAAVAFLTLVIELGLVWLLFFPRRFRLACFLIVTPFQLGIILTANLAFLNHLVLSLGFLLLDDRFLRFVFARYTREVKAAPSSGGAVRILSRWWKAPETEARQSAARDGVAAAPRAATSISKPWARAVTGVLFGWIFYVTLALLLLLLAPRLPLPQAPIEALEPFRIANQYGLFAVMTRARYEIEFQGSRDGRNWTPYPFRYKPQDPARRPGFYAPYQPRFDWNLWFATLGGTWRQYPFVVRTEALLLLNDRSVLSLFVSNPFGGSPPTAVRAVTWQYWFTSIDVKRSTGLWWRRKVVGLYAPALARLPDGRIAVLPSDDRGSQ